MHEQFYVRKQCIKSKNRIVVGEYLEDKEYSGECATSRICKIRVHSM